MTALPTSLIVLYPGCIAFEVLLVCELLSKKFSIQVATPDGTSHVSNSGLVYQADYSFHQLDLSKFRHQFNCVVIPGGDTYEVFEDQLLLELIRTACREELLVAAICAGPLLLAKAGVLEGRKFTHGFGELHKDFLAPFWSGATFTDDAVTVDRRVITAKPEAFIEFAVQIALTTGALENSRAEYCRQYYRGFRNVDLNA